MVASLPDLRPKKERKNVKCDFRHPGSVCKQQFLVVTVGAVDVNDCRTQW